MKRNLNIEKEEILLLKKIGRKYLDLLETLFKNIEDYPYDIKYLKKIVKEAEKDYKKGKIIKAKNIDDALRKIKADK